MTNQPPIQTRFFHAYITLPGNDQNRYVRNITLGVMAGDMDAALAEVKAAYPDSEIWSIQHCGPVHLGVVRVTGVRGGAGYHEEDLPKGA